MLFAPTELNVFMIIFMCIIAKTMFRCNTWSFFRVGGTLTCSEQQYAYRLYTSCKV